MVVVENRKNATFSGTTPTLALVRVMTAGLPMKIDIAQRGQYIGF